MAADLTAHERFLQSVGPFLDLWTSFDFRYSSYRHGEEWRNLFSIGVLGWEGVDAPHSELIVDQPRFRVGRLIVPREAGLAVVCQDMLPVELSGDLAALSGS
jgi:hypothetical protein